MKKGFIIGSIDPIHYGHIDLIKSGLKYVDKIDFYVGNGSRSKLPRELRIKTLDLVLKELNLEEKVNYNFVNSENKQIGLKKLKFFSFL